MSSKNQQKLSLAHLIGCLSDPAAYKHVKAYLSKADEGNEEVENMLSEAMLHVFQSKTIQVAAKMHALKLFKDIFETGNMDLVEALDEKIEEHIVTVASYKKDRKIADRGENYFVETEKREMNPQTRLLGMSYVILALEIIQNLGEWYPVSEDNEESRFKTYKTMLVSRGVTFPPTSSYFKPADRTKFENNYAKWKKSLMSSKPESLNNILSSQLKMQSALFKPSKAPESSPINNQHSFPVPHESVKVLEEKNASKVVSKEQTQIQSKHAYNNDDWEALREVRSQLAKVTDENLQLQRSAKEKEEKLEQLKSQLAKMQKESREELTRLKKQNERLLSSLNQANVRTDDIRRYEDEQKEKSNAIRQLKEQHHLERERLEDRLAELESRLEKSCDQLKEQKANYARLEAEHRSALSRLEHEPVENIKDKLMKRINQESTRANILIEDLSQSRQNEAELNRQIQKLRRQVSSLKNQHSISHQNSERQPVLENLALKEKCRLLQLKVKNVVITPQAMVRTQQHGSSQELSSNRDSTQLRFHRTNNNFFRARGRMSSHSRRHRMNKTSQLEPRPGQTWSPDVMVRDSTQPTTLLYDDDWFKPLNLKMYLFRNALLGKRKPFYDSEELEIKLTPRKNNQFTLTFKNKTRRELKINCRLKDDDHYLFSDTDFKDKMMLASGKSIESQLGVLPTEPSHRYAQGTLLVNGRQSILFLPITISSYCEFEQPRSKPSENYRIVSQTFLLDYRILSPQELFAEFCCSDSKQAFHSECCMKYRIDPSLRVLIAVSINKTTNKCELTASYEEPSKELAVSILRVLMFCWKHPSQ